MKKRIAATALIILGIFSAVLAQNKGNETSADRSLRGSGRVNASTLGMEFDLPLGAYPGRGINVPINLSYSSKVWRMQYVGETPIPGGNYSSCYSQYSPEFAEESASGWTTSLAAPYIEYIGAKTAYQYSGEGVSSGDVECPDTNGGGGGSYASYYVRRLLVHLPGGETHELRPDDSITSINTLEAWNAVYYAADGSNIKYIQNSATGTYRLSMPDGSFYDFDPNAAHQADRKAYRFTDRNGNYTSYFAPGSVDEYGVTHPNGYWKDTLGRNISIPLGLQAPGAPTAAGTPQVYSMPGMTGTYKFHWKKLKGDTAAESGLTNFSDNLRYYGDRYVGSAGACNNTYPTFCDHPAGTYLFNGGDALILSSFVFNPIVLTEIELPTGQKYKFTYDVYGRIEQIKYPTGGEEHFTYEVVPTLSMLEPTDVSGSTNFGVTNRKVYKFAGDTAPYEWTYSANYVTAQAGYQVNINNPNGTRVERFLHRGNGANTLTYFGYDNALAGMAYEERAYDGSNPRKLVSKKITAWTVTQFTTSGGGTAAPAQWHPRVTQEESIVYDNAGNGVSATAKYEYEEESTLTRDKPLLQKKGSQYAFVVAGNAPPATPVRTSENTFLINDTAVTNRQDYKDRNMVGLVTASVVKDSAGTIVSRSEMKYDDAGYSPSDYVRGNPTTSRVWDSTKGAWNVSTAYIETKARFDAYGNQYEAIDAKGNLTVTTFDSTYNAFPIQVTTAAPDPSGQNGSNQGFVTTATFDTTTGLPLTTTDANGLETRIEYDPVTLRPIRTKNYHSGQQVGSQSETVYHDETNNYWIKNRSQIDQNNWAESITYFDGLGRAYKAEETDAQGNIYVEKEFDSDGRVLRVTNPFRANETKQWTTNVYDNASRVVEVVLPDGAKVKTDYGVSTVAGVIGTTKQITDQAGKKRKGITDALGRMVRVIEDPDGQNLSTDYVFDTLGNLRKTIQGEQSRYFIDEKVKWK